MPIDEAHPQNPTNPYGESKLIVEQMLRWCDLAHGLKFCALRYFNVAGRLARRVHRRRITGRRAT